MPKLLVKTTLAYFFETQCAKDGDDFARFQYRRPRHR